jgi:hypothetical protein
LLDFSFFDVWSQAEIRRIFLVLLYILVVISTVVVKKTLN